MNETEEKNLLTFDLDVNGRGILQQLEHIFEVTLRASPP